MKKEVSREEVSRFRQQVARLTERLKALALKAGYCDLLFRGVPLEVYRKCGKATCRCMIGGERHGPYKVIQVWRKKKSRQVTLRRGEEHNYEMAKHYQYQMRNRAEILEIQEQLIKAVDEIIERRCIWEKD